MRAQNEFLTYYEGPWQYNENNKTIDEYFRYGVERAKPYERNSLWTMAMRGSGDTAIEGLGIDAITTMLETLVDNQREIMAEGLGIDIEDISTVPQLWCLYNEVQSYQERGLVVPGTPPPLLIKPAGLLQISLTHTRGYHSPLERRQLGQCQEAATCQRDGPDRRSWRIVSRYFSFHNFVLTDQELQLPFRLCGSCQELQMDQHDSAVENG